eukprot:SAG11_NODE_1649_length_4511_cov_3.281505_3_plen_101_part_00
MAFVHALYIPIALFWLPSGVVNLGCGAIYGRWYGTLVALGGYHGGAFCGAHDWWLATNQLYLLLHTARVCRAAGGALRCAALRTRVDPKEETDATDLQAY